ncbi:MAG: hypothetical protein ACKO1H_01150 [Tabrizicola sp.]
MSKSSLLAAVASYALWPFPVHSCMMAAELVLEDVRLADVVVIGAIENYKVVLDPKAREERKALLERLPADTDPEFREILESQDAFLSDYARFDVLVGEVLLGTASDRISVVWDNSTFGEPDKVPTGSYLVALIAPTSPQPPLRGPSATVLPRPDASSLSVLQAPCSGAFIFPVDATAVAEIRAILAKD